MIAGRAWSGRVHGSKRSRVYHCNVTGGEGWRAGKNASQPSEAAVVCWFRCALTGASAAITDNGNKSG
jgi:hypothetical protein